MVAAALLGDAAVYVGFTVIVTGFALGFWVLAGISAVSVVACITLVRGREHEQTATGNFSSGSTWASEP